MAFRCCTGGMGWASGDVRGEALRRGLKGKGCDTGGVWSVRKAEGRGLAERQAVISGTVGCTASIGAEGGKNASVQKGRTALAALRATAVYHASGECGSERKAASRGVSLSCTCFLGQLRSSCPMSPRHWRRASSLLLPPTRVCVGRSRSLAKVFPPLSARASRASGPTVGRAAQPHCHSAAPPVARPPPPPLSRASSSSSSA